MSVVWTLFKLCDEKIIIIKWFTLIRKQSCLQLLFHIKTQQYICPHPNITLIWYKYIDAVFFHLILLNSISEIYFQEKHHFSCKTVKVYRKISIFDKHCLTITQRIYIYYELWIQFNVFFCLFVCLFCCFFFWGGGYDNAILISILPSMAAIHPRQKIHSTFAFAITWILPGHWAIKARVNFGWVPRHCHIGFWDSVPASKQDHYLRHRPVKSTSQLPIPAGTSNPGGLLDCGHLVSTLTCRNIATLT